MPAGLRDLESYLEVSVGSTQGPAWSWPGRAFSTEKPPSLSILQRCRQAQIPRKGKTLIMFKKLFVGFSGGEKFNNNIDNLLN